MHILIIIFHYVSSEIAILQADANASASGKSQRQAVAEAGQGWGLRCPCGCVWKCGYRSIPINTIFRGMNIHLPAILMFTRVQGFDPSPCVYHQIAIETGKKTRWVTPRGPQDPSCGMTDEHIVMGGWLILWNPTALQRFGLDPKMQKAHIGCWTEFMWFVQRRYPVLGGAVGVMNE